MKFSMVRASSMAECYDHFSIMISTREKGNVRTKFLQLTMFGKTSFSAAISEALLGRMDHCKVKSMSACGNGEWQRVAGLSSQRSLT